MSIRPMTAKNYRKLISVSQRQQPATVWFKDAHYLNVYTGQVEKGHITLSGERIAYVGDQEPLTNDQTTIVKLNEEQVLVPGYIEPHAHPFQWYNPLTWGEWLLTKGTTVSINDNMFLIRALSDREAIQFIEELDSRGQHMWLWWARFDGQTATARHEARFSEESVKKWLAHPLVIQGGELTSWPLLLKGDEELANWMRLARQTYGKRIEGHLPGASSETLNILAAAGVGADHEALNGEDVLKRLRLGLYATLRYSSIRPDLPDILREIREMPGINPALLMLTNDGSMPYFVDQSGCPEMLKMVLEAGFVPEDAYRMVSLNPATYYGLDQELGGIAPGRLAHINILNGLENPQPIHVMVEGEWVVRDGKRLHPLSGEWLTRYFQPLKENIKINTDDLKRGQGQIGLQLVNNVITRPYTYDPQQPLADDEAYLSLVANRGEWVLNTRVKGFTGPALSGLASTFTSSEHYILVGRDYRHMVSALDQALQLGGGIAAFFEDGNQLIIPLPLAGGMSLLSMAELKSISETFVKQMKAYGYPHQDPIYSLLFFTATHLPYVRLTSDGVYLIKEQRTATPVTRLG
ncbi:adenine deaminase [Caldalkalibacillus uzonensis]|uniref:adenine deaminase n=1 Tax=Caldalkalibacillus uzonensis TaxID=353224 RepID=A0ABU0CUL5_9BACI|nr:adenine deaminase C-terminal domain-containing protein [Caldalkalibacillus uzonensis]MDQ0340123.1 adenine deaminase [Caldalkalibacillus uzonensis]